MSTPLDAMLGASLDQELAGLRDEPFRHTILTHIAEAIRAQFPDRPDLARIVLCAARTGGRLADSIGMPPELVPAALGLLAGELDRLEREAQS